MTERVEHAIERLEEVLDGMRRVAVAVSGGVDSITLACAAHRRLGVRAAMYHAVSPAVPPEATERTRRHAERYGWRLEVVGAGEFADEDYVRNPANRCFFCKSNLYARISRSSQATIVSGTNLDDLADYRPGLTAAEQFAVRHPYVEARIDKTLVRAIAESFGLQEAAELPASPCLSSRVETGIRVDEQTLRLVHAVEKAVGNALQPETVRCRVRRHGLTIELDGLAYARMAAEPHTRLRAEIRRIGRANGFPGEPDFAPYRMGSAFRRARSSSS